MAIKIGNLDFGPRKVWFKTFGCQMNYHDTERILSHLREMNFSLTRNPEEADLIIFNTCAIREKANLKFYSQLGEIKHLKIKNLDLLVGICGCVSQIEGEELLKKYKHLDFAFGTDSIDQINDILYRLYSGEKRIFANSWDKSANYSIDTKITHGSPQAFVNIIKGCNNFCSYCIVPYTRGREKSRKLGEIVEDVKNLVKKGVQEVTLLGQNVNSFGKENGESLADLLEELDKIEGLEIIRYTTSHPYDMSDELIKAHGTIKKLSNHVHLPAQSGSNSVLQRMNRKYTKEHFLNLCKKLRKSNTNIVISSDIIVGFPNETEEEFEETMQFLEEAQFDFIYSYKFSPRYGTKAAKMEDLLEESVKSQRLRKLQQHQLEIQKKLRNKLEGQVLRVLVEGKGTMKGVERWHGRSNCNRIVHFKAKENEKDYLWNWVDLKIDSATALACKGELIKNYGKTPPSF